MDSTPGVLRLLDAQAWWLAPAYGSLHCLRQEVRRFGGVPVGAVRWAALRRLPQVRDDADQCAGQGIRGAIQRQAGRDFCAGGRATCAARISRRDAELD